MFNSSLSALQAGNHNQALPFQKIFEAQLGLVLVLSPQLTIQGATDAYLRETLTIRENIIGKHVLDIFPDNPDAPDTSATVTLKNSIEQALSTGKPHKVDMLQYDIPDPDNLGSFIERYWSTTNTPMLDEQGEIICIIHETTNVSEEVKARLQLEQSQKREQEALAQAEQQRLRLERLFEQAPAALAMLEGPEFVFRVLNTSYQQLFPGRQMLDLPLFEALPELKNQAVYDIMLGVYNTGETFEGKEVLIPVARYQGQPMEDIYWNFICQALFDADGKVNGILIFALDVTEFVEARRQVEKSAESLQAMNRELEERVERRTKELSIAKAEAVSQKQQLENLIMQAPSAICILDGPAMTFQLVNPIYQQIFPGREIQGKSLLEALPELEGTDIPAILGKVYHTGKTFVAHEFPLMLARHEGGPLEEIYWNFTYQVRRNGEGLVDGLLAYAHEVTNQVEARKAVEVRAQQLQLITDSLPVLISYLDRDEKYRFANHVYEEWFNLKVENILGRTIVEVVGEKAYKNTKDYITRALAGESLDFEAAMPYREGFRHIRTSYVPDFSKDEVVGFYALITDVTEPVNSRKALERSEQEAKSMAKELAKANDEFQQVNLELELTNQQLKHINTDLDNFIYTASHDLKAPISNIEMLMEELLVELPQQIISQKEVETILGMMKGAIARFKKTISSLTEIAKLQQDVPSLDDNVSIEEVVKEVSLDMAQVILRSNARIETSLEDGVTVFFSEKNLRSIVYNLLSNSVKYRHPQRELLIMISCREEREYIILEVQDNGLGLSAKQQGKLFTMFRRFHDHVEGSGVGLYMVKRIVDNAGGKIEVESEVNKGSTFSVYFRK